MFARWLIFSLFITSTGFSAQPNTIPSADVRADRLLWNLEGAARRVTHDRVRLATGLLLSGILVSAGGLLYAVSYDVHTRQREFGSLVTGLGLGSALAGTLLLLTRRDDERNLTDLFGEIPKKSGQERLNYIEHRFEELAKEQRSGRIKRSWITIGLGGALVGTGLLMKNSDPLVKHLVLGPGIIVTAAGLSNLLFWGFLESEWDRYKTEKEDLGISWNPRTGFQVIAKVNW